MSASLVLAKGGDAQDGLKGVLGILDDLGLLGLMAIAGVAILLFFTIKFCWAKFVTHKESSVKVLVGSIIVGLALIMPAVFGGLVVSLFQWITGVGVTAVSNTIPG